MVRRVLLVILLIIVGLAMINGAVVGQLPAAWVPNILVTVEHYVGAEKAVIGGVFGAGLILTAVASLWYLYRLWLVLAIVYAVLSVAIQVDRYYGGQGDVLPPIVFWVAATALMLVLFPTGSRAAAGVEPGVKPASWAGS